MIAAHAAELSDVLAEAVREGWAFVCLDGTLISSTRVSAPSDSGHDLWYSGNANNTAATSRSSPARPVTPNGSARSNRARPTTSPPPKTRTARAVPGRRPRPADPDRQGLHRRRNRHHGPDEGPQRQPRQPGPQHLDQRPCAHPLKGTWKALERITLNPWRIPSLGVVGVGLGSGAVDSWSGSFAGLYTNRRKAGASIIAAPARCRPGGRCRLAHPPSGSMDRPVHRRFPTKRPEAVRRPRRRTRCQSQVRRLD